MVYFLHVVLPMVLLMCLTPTITASTATTSGNIDVCNSSLGLQDGRVKDSQLSATSYRSYMYISRLGKSYNMKAKHGRLNNKLAWCGLGPFRNIRPVSYFQVDFGEEVYVSGLATQGFKSFNSYFVKTYKLKFSFNGSDWFNYSTSNKVWMGNMDGNTVKRNYFNTSVQTRYIRIYPVKYNIYRCLRVEVYGCRMKQNDTSMSSTTSSSTAVPDMVGTPTVPTSSKAVARPTVPASSEVVARISTEDTSSPNTPTVGPVSKGCNSSLGLQDGRVKDSQLSATSYKSYMYISRLGSSFNMKAKHGRLNNKLAWCGLGPFRNIRPVSYFQVDFGEEVYVTGLATQGFKNFHSYFVRTYKLRFSFNGSDWFNYSTSNKVWMGNMDGNTVKRNYFNTSVQTRYIRIYPVKYNIYRCLRVEVYGCRMKQNGTSMSSTTSSSTAVPDMVGTPTVPTSSKAVARPTVPASSEGVARISTEATSSPNTPTVGPVSQGCNSALGLQDGRVKDSQLSATSYRSYMYISRLRKSYNMKAKHGRLNNKLAWCGLGPFRNIRPVSYFQVDFGEEVHVTGLATQGFNNLNSYFVKTYKLKFSFDGSVWFNYSRHNKVWPGNDDGTSIKRVVFDTNIRTRYLRIYPQEFKYYRCLRVEVYGCRHSENASQMTSLTGTPAIQESQLNANESTYNIHSSLPDQTTKGYISTAASQEIIFFITGCVGGVVFMVISVLIFTLWRKYTRLRGYTISSSNWGYEIPLELKDQEKSNSERLL